LLSAISFARFSVGGTKEIAPWQFGREDVAVLTGIDWLDNYLPRAAMVFWDNSPLGAAII
jgi:hypothetical protein